MLTKYLRLIYIITMSLYKNMIVLCKCIDIKVIIFFIIKKKKELNKINKKCLIKNKIILKD